MIDIQFIRDNPELVATKAAQKGYPVDISKLLDIDMAKKQILQEVEALRAAKNELSDQMKGGKPEPELIAKSKQIKLELVEKEELLTKRESELETLMKSVPNMPLDTVPIGASEDENVVVETIGTKPAFDFKPRNHWEIAEAKGWLDKVRATKVAGSRFLYLKGDLVRMQFALVNYVMDRLGDSTWLQGVIDKSKINVSAKPFTPAIPPMMINTEVFDAMDRLEPRDERYQVGDESDNLWMQGSAEHTLGSMYYKETLNKDDLPIRYIGYATSFRREAGTYGKDTEGMIRNHQFDKLEMESFSSVESGPEEHKLFLAVQKELMNELGLYYRVLNKCTFDIGKPNASGWDLDSWLPGQDKFRETHSADYMSDYQTRRLQTRYRDGDNMKFAHTNDATAVVLSRVPVAIIEQYQTSDGSVRVPEVLQPYMGGKKVI
jgi:seryl-tRNA synthetase